MLDGEPFVAALPVAHEPRRARHSGLQVLPHRNLAGAEEGDVAPDVAVYEVLRARVETLQRVLELGEIARAVDHHERLELLGGPEAHPLHAQRGPGGWIEPDDRPVVAPRSDQRGRGHGRGRRNHYGVVRDAVAHHVHPEYLRDRHQRLARVLVHGGQAARRCAVRNDLLVEPVGDVVKAAGGAPGDMAVVAVNDPGGAGDAAAEDGFVVELEPHGIEQRRDAERDVRVVGDQRAAVARQRTGDRPEIGPAARLA